MSGALLSAVKRPTRHWDWVPESQGVFPVLLPDLPFLSSSHPMGLVF